VSQHDESRIERVVRDLERCSDPVALDAARDLTATLLSMHRDGLARVLELVARTDRALLDSFARDERVAALLLLHDLHPVGLEDRVIQALEKVGSFVRSKGARVELREANDGTVRLSLSGEGPRCPSTARALRDAIDRAIVEAAPDVSRLTIEEAVDSPGSSVFLPVLNGFSPP
jgi:Fe-S cluster biogenesis protein NfuA